MAARKCVTGSFQEVHLSLVKPRRGRWGEGLQNGSRVGTSGFEPLAQLVEHWTFNPGVEGSSLFSCTSKARIIRRFEHRI